MSASASAQSVDHLVDWQAIARLDVIGATIQLFDVPGEHTRIMRGTITARGLVPLHNHPDFETLS